MTCKCVLLLAGKRVRPPFFVQPTSTLPCCLHDALPFDTDITLALVPIADHACLCNTTFRALLQKSRQIDPPEIPPTPTSMSTAVSPPVASAPYPLTPTYPYHTWTPTVPGPSLPPGKYKLKIGPYGGTVKSLSPKPESTVPASVPAPTPTPAPTEAPNLIAQLAEQQRQQILLRHLQQRQQEAEQTGICSYCVIS